MGARSRTALALLFTVLVCSYQWMMTRTPPAAGLYWLLGALALLGVVVAINVHQMRATGQAIGLSHGRRLPTAGLNLAFIATLAIAGFTLAQHLGS